MYVSFLFHAAIFRINSDCVRSWVHVCARMKESAADPHLSPRENEQPA